MYRMYSISFKLICTCIVFISFMYMYDCAYMYMYYIDGHLLCAAMRGHIHSGPGAAYGHPREFLADQRTKYETESCESTTST